MTSSSVSVPDLGYGNGSRRQAGAAVDFIPNPVLAGSTADGSASDSGRLLPLRWEPVKTALEGVFVKRQPRL